MDDLSRDRHATSAHAVYDASARRYVEMIGTEISPATEGPIDRALLDAFVELIDEGSRVVADVGCGPGRVASYLSSRAVTAVGIDPSTAMLAEARRAHPDITFELGRLDDLPLSNATMSGAVCWYSIIHTPPAGLVRAFEELHRVLVPGGHLLLAFQAGANEAVHRDNAHGTGLSLTSYRHDVVDVTRQLGQCGFEVHTTAQRRPQFDHEVTVQAFVIARRS